MNIPIHRLVVAAFSLLFVTLSAPAADLPPEFLARSEKARKAIPLGGDFKPDPKQPVFIAVGHGARILVSRDDGRTWTQTHFAYPGSDHGAWATNSIAYTNGVFAVPIGWVRPTSYLASEDGVNWRHLTDGHTVLDRRTKDPTSMPTAMSVAGGNGVFVFTGYMNATATPDFGKTWSEFSFYTFKKQHPDRNLVTHHVKTTWLGDESGRFLAVANDRAKENANFGNLFASDDLGKTWKWIDPKGLDALKDYTGIAFNGKVVLIVDKAGANAYVSSNGGETWDGPHATGGGKYTSMNIVGGEFWLTSKPPRASADGKTWRDLPKAVPNGKIAESITGTLISASRGRTNILRSDDGGETWTEVYKYDPPDTPHIHGGQGLRDVIFGHTTAEAAK